MQVNARAMKYSLGTEIAVIGLLGLAHGLVLFLFALAFRASQQISVGAVFLGLLAAQMCLAGFFIGTLSRHFATSILFMAAGFVYGTMQLILGFQGINFAPCLMLCGIPMVVNSCVGMICRRQLTPLLGLATPTSKAARQIHLVELLGTITIIACLLSGLQTLGRLSPTSEAAGPAAMAGLFTITSWLPIVVSCIPAGFAVQHATGLLASMALGVAFPLLMQSTNLGFWGASTAAAYLSLVLSLTILQTLLWTDTGAVVEASGR